MLHHLHQLNATDTGQHARPSVLTVAGLDSSGHAGLHADIVTQRALGVHASAVVTALTAQNQHGVHHIVPTDVESMEQQLRANLACPPTAVKSGMLGGMPQLQWLTAKVTELAVPWVCDPVIKSTSGADLIPEHALYKLKADLSQIMLLTPNTEEAETLSEVAIHSHHDMPEAAHCLLKMGVTSVCITGGHLPYTSATGEEFIADYYADHATQFWMVSPRQSLAFTRGTGCVFASACAAALAWGYSAEDAVVVAKMTLNQALRHGYASGFGGQGPVHVLRFPDSQEDMPHIVSSLKDFEVAQSRKFADCGSDALGVYPIIDDVSLLPVLLDAGVTTVQLRIKQEADRELAEQIEAAVTLCRQRNCRLFINDHWQLAIRYGAYGVHLGQEDLQTADLSAIANAGLRLGVSTHCLHEMGKALAISPSYLATGPVFPTLSKAMPWVEQRPEGLKYWQDLVSLPLVAIGGINRSNFEQVRACGVDGIAIMSAITDAPDPKAEASYFVDWFAAKPEVDRAV